MAKTLKRIDAGAIQKLVLYDRCSRWDSPVKRQAKRQNSSEAQRKMNQKYSYQKLEELLATNFPAPGSAIFATLPCDDAHMPRDRKQMQLYTKNFFKKLREAREALGLPDPVAFWAIEVLSSESCRWHLHLVIDSTGQDYNIIRACWIYGSEIDMRKLGVPKKGEGLPPWQDRNAGEPGNYFLAVARYMTKELRDCQEYDARPGLRGWSCTRNVKRPEVETMTVPDDYDLKAPKGSTVILDERKKTEWASYHVLKYRFSGAGFVAAPKAKRRRRRRD